MRIVKLGTGFIRELKYTQDGSALLAVSGTGHHAQGLKILDLATGSIVREEPIQYGGEMALTADLSTLVRVNMDRAQFPPLWFLEVHDLNRHRQLQRLPLRLELTGLSFSPDAQLLLVAGTNYAEGMPVHEVDRWLWHNAKDLPPLVVPWPVVSCTMTRDRKLLVTGGLDNAVRFWRNDSGVIIDEWKHKASVRRLLFTDGDRLLVAAAGCSVAVWDMESRCQRVRFRPHRKQVNDIALSPDGRLLATASSDGTVRLWDIAAAVERRSFAWGIGKVGSVAFAPDGLTIAAGGEAGQIVLWDVDV